jgi:hypothetical protein
MIASAWSGYCFATPWAPAKDFVSSLWVASLTFAPDAAIAAVNADA